MTEKPTEGGNHQDSVAAYNVPVRNLDDHVRLRDLFCVVMQHRWVVAITILLCVLVISIYIMRVEPVYRAESKLLPPLQQQVQGLSVYLGENVVIDAKSYVPEVVYTEFLKNLKSQGLRRKFFDENNLLNSYIKDSPDPEVNADKVFNVRFNDAISIREDKHDPTWVTITFDNARPEVAAKLLNQYVEFVNAYTIRQLVLGVNSVIAAEVGIVRHQIDSKLKYAKQRKLDNIAALKEALNVATGLGITDASVMPIVMDRARTGLAVNTAQVPLYMRGAKALDTQIKVLESRESDAPFTPGLRELQERQGYLEGISIDRDRLSAVTVDLTAKPPYREKSPRVTGLLLLAVTLGLVLGVILVFMYEFLKPSRR